MKNTIQQFIDRNKLFVHEDRLLLAVSGGMDSMVMANILLSLGYDIALIHCNFKLRTTASDEDETFVLNWAKTNNLVAYARSFDTKAYAKKKGISTQMAARDLRYAYFEEIRTSEGYDYLLTAHHLDDRLETFWLNFARGSGWKGLSSLKAKIGIVRRPLLEVDRAQIARFQATHNVAFREDESNASNAYRRNAFRHQVLPALYGWTPELANTSPSNFRRMEQMLSIYMEATKSKLTALTEGKEEDRLFHYPALAEDPARETLIWELLNPLGFNAEQCRQAWEAKTGTLLCADNWQLLVQEKHWRITTTHSTEVVDTYFWLASEHEMELNDGLVIRKARVVSPGKFKADQHRVYLSYAKLIFPLQLRYWEVGDRFCPLGMKGESQKLQDFFGNNKIDRLERTKTWLLVNGNNDIIWVLGHRIDDRYKIGIEDTEALRCDILGL